MLACQTATPRPLIDAYPASYAEAERDAIERLRASAESN